MKLFLAAPFEELSRMKVIKQRIEAETIHRVVASWLNEPEGPFDAAPDEASWTPMAMRDIVEVKSANILLLDTFATNQRGGSNVEYGFAMGFQKQVWLVGPIRNVFHTMAQRKFPNWDQVIEELKEWVAPDMTIRQAPKGGVPYDPENDRHWSDEWRKR